ncbi:nucleotide exchange factor GrpE [Acuticoccus sp. M5D2P5]|uniref:nucleotide exchange factor GrpE n=1 Tax=Acuticoccus kalidii TaxID=2910977 RepID=UPI001F2FD2CE|nr:nucleotide exchange factor GrpE [Acuticoccus kalidii]MCF3933908.1 nucleotide exchange factor GrpE [Acuticoccus kalidii]
MADENKTGAPKGARAEDTLVPEAEEIMGQAANGPSAEGEASDHFTEAMDELRRESEEMRQHMLRALAEAENVRRRAQRDLSDARQYAVTSFARDLLSVSDNFQRALQSVDNLNADDLPPEVKGLLDGVRMTERELASVFEKHGISVIEPNGEKFDPNKHQAMYEIENPDVPSGTVLQVAQTGAMIGDRVLRPAMVGVSKGGPKPNEAPKAANDANATDGGEA